MILIEQALYVSSALSFYFAYDFCLFRDLLAELSYFFRYLPFLVSIALSIAILFLRYCVLGQLCIYFAS